MPRFPILPVIAALLLYGRAGAADSWTGYRDGWPIGATMDDMRGMQKCIGPATAQPGEELKCRPSLPNDYKPIALTFGWASGPSATQDDIIGYHGFLLDVSYGLTRSLQLGIRGEVGGIDLSLHNRNFGFARYRFFYDETDRNSFFIHAGAGPAFSIDRPTEWLGQGIIGWETGLFVGRESTFTLALELGWVQSLRFDSPGGINAMIRTGFELGVREPQNIGSADSKDLLTFSLDTSIGSRIGAGFSIAPNLTSPVYPFASVKYQTGSTTGLKYTGYDNARWAADVGVRINMPWWLYGQASYGIESFPSTDTLRGAITAEVGFIPFECVGFELGFQMATPASDFSPHTYVASLRHWFGKAAGSASGCGGERRIRIMHEPVAPVRPPPNKDYEPPTPIETTPPPVAPKPQPLPPAPRPPQTITVTVSLGWYVLGTQISFDWSALPLSQLTQAGIVDIELSGSRDVLPSLEARLRTRLRARNVRTRHVSYRYTGYGELKATFSFQLP